VKFLTLLTFIFLISKSSLAFNNEMFLKAGTNFSLNRLGVFEKEEPGSDDRGIAEHSYFGGFGFNTHFGYRWERYEFTISSTIVLGKVEDLSFVINENSFKGSGNYQNLMVSPTLRYFVPWKPLKEWRINLGTGPIWSQQTVRLKEFVSTGPFSGRNFKLTYDSVGWGISIGLEENLKYKEMHPVYVELSYVRLYSLRAYLVDTSDSTKSNVLSKSEAKKDVRAEALILSIGIVLF